MNDLTHDFESLIDRMGKDAISVEGPAAGIPNDFFL